MNVYMKCSLAVALIALSGPLAAQSTQEVKKVEEVRRVAETREVEMSMREAEKRFEEAAQRIAELSASQLARAGQFQGQWMIQNDKPKLGITIEDESDDGKPVAGVSVAGITPGAAAEEAGLRSGDIISSINGESFKAQSKSEANRKLLDFMDGVEDGDVLDVEYLRDSRAGKAQLSPKPATARMFDFNFGPGLAAPNAPNAPAAPQAFAYRWIGRHGGHGFGDMEMVELNKDLGRYFGTDSGLLIVKAPEGNSFKLQDGDVIKTIDGREPKDLMHAIRILGSYEGGEIVNIDIMRDKKKQTVKVELPANQQSRLLPAPAATSAVGPAPAPVVVIAPKVKVVRRTDERT